MTARRKARPASPAQVPLPLLKTGGPKFIAVASGKGGVGKSFFSAALAWTFAESGSRVIAVDADFGGPNLHTCLGVRATEAPGLAALAAGRPLAEVISPTAHPALGLVSGIADPLNAPNSRTSAWHEALERLGESDAKYVLLDLGAGSMYTTLDFFLAAGQGIVVTTPEPTAMENAYRFLKTLFFRFAATRAPTERIRRLVSESLRVESSQGQVRSPAALLAEISGRHAGIGVEMEAALAALDVRILVNQVRTEADAALPEAMALAARKVFALPCRSLGSVPYDAEVSRAVRERKPFLLLARESPAAAAIAAIAARLNAEAEGGGVSP